MRLHPLRLSRGLAAGHQLPAAAVWEDLPHGGWEVASSTPITGRREPHQARWVTSEGCRRPREDGRWKPCKARRVASEGWRKPSEACRLTSQRASEGRAAPIARCCGPPQKLWGRPCRSPPSQIAHRRCCDICRLARAVTRRGRQRRGFPRKALPARSQRLPFATTAPCSRRSARPHHICVAASPTKGACCIPVA